MQVPADLPSAQCRGRKRRLRPIAHGFTLLEVLLAMAILVVLVAGLAGITGASMRLGKTVLEAQQEDAIRDGFERLIRENLAEIPQDSPLLLREGILNGSQTVILGKAAGLFPVSGLPLVTESVALETRRDRSGLFSLWLLYYAGDLARAIQDNSMDSELLVQIPFKDGLEFLRWRVYDPTTDEWLDVWEETGRRPHYLEMTYRFAGDTADHRMVFWMPRLQSNPGGQGGGPGGGLTPNLPGGGGSVGPGNPGGASGRPNPGGGRPGIRVEVPR